MLRRKNILTFLSFFKKLATILGIQKMYFRGNK